MATIKMRRLRANIPDEGRNIVLVWEDRGNPMKDLAFPVMENGGE